MSRSPRAEPTSRRRSWWRRAALPCAPLIGLGLLVLPTPSGLSEAAWRVAAVAVWMAGWWLTEAVPLPATALLPLVLFPLLGVRALPETAAPYAHPVIYLFLGGFLIAAALERCGLHRRFAVSVIKAVGPDPRRLIGGVMLATAFLSMWVSNTATAVIMLPLAVSLLPRSKEAAERMAPAMLLGVAYAANIGGLGTLIGTPPNAFLAGFLSSSYGIEVGFVRWMVVGIPVVAIALPITWWLLVDRLHPVAADLEGTTAKLPTGHGPLSSEEWVVGSVTAMVCGAWVTRPVLERFLPGLSDAGIAIAGALLLLCVPVALRPTRFALSWKDAERLPWGVLVLFGGGLSLAGAIQESGLAAWLGSHLEALGGLPLPLLVATIVLLMVFLTELTSNTATAAAFLPIVAALAVAIGDSPLLLAVPAALAASCAFMLPVATPPNAVVYGSGKVELADMMRAGLRLNLLMTALITAVTLMLASRLG